MVVVNTPPYLKWRKRKPEQNQISFSLVAVSQIMWPEVDMKPFSLTVIPSFTFLAAEVRRWNVLHPLLHVLQLFRVLHGHGVAKVCGRPHQGQLGRPSSSRGMSTSRRSQDCAPPLSAWRLVCVLHFRAHKMCTPSSQWDKQTPVWRTTEGVLAVLVINAWKYIFGMEKTHNTSH